ncbi:MAG: hypothetical protein KDD38_06930, partial [Bdellovibrionales bacterium]|nr:hypothetical protein [Bdellovibrionales bacterium]
MYILGISAFYHDSAVSLIKDGEILSAAQEERFTRIKHDPSFPIEAIQYCLSEQKIKLSDVDYIVFYEKPFLKFDRLLENYFAFAPKGFLSYIKAMPAWIGEKLFLKNLMIKKLKKIDSDYNYKKTPLLFTEHHQSHTASAYYPSPFDEAIIITADGVGEWSTTTISLGKGHELREVRKIEYPHSLGLLYSAFTYFTGFKVNSGEYKLMGLAPYGRPLYVDKIKQNIIDIKDDGSFHLNMDYFTFATSGRMTHHKFEELFNCKTRKPESPLEQIHMDLAASVQQVTEEIMIKMVNYAVREFGIKKLCLAGGVALNCVANGEILRRCEIDDIWIQPAAGDAGGALGAALSVWHQYLNKPKLKTSSDTLKGTYLGPEFTDSEIEEMLNKKNIAYTKADSKDSLCHQVVDHITNDKTIGWFQGRMEYGPRALGNRSI